MESLESSLDSEMRSRIIGVKTQMLHFDFIFGVRTVNLVKLATGKGALATTK